jgi:hypothetical protein
LSTLSTKFQFQLADPTDAFDNDKFIKGNFNLVESLVYNKTEIDAKAIYGSNANGSYIKFDNGVMISYASVAAVSGTGVKNTAVLTYPVTFISAPYTTIQHVSSAGVFASYYVYNNVTTGFTIYHVGASNIDLDGTSFKWIAIGRWK